MTLEPQLTKLDERVLAALDRQSGQRLAQIMKRIHRHDSRYYIFPRTREEDVRLILRGFEHLGKAQCRGGWWRAL